MRTWFLFCFLVALVLAAGSLFGGCGHCRPPEVRAAKFGTVLECKDETGPGHGPDVKCLISTPDGDVYHYFRSCE